MIAFGNRRKYWMTATAAVFSLVATTQACAQIQGSEPGKRSFTLEEAVEFALKNEKLGPDFRAWLKSFPV